MFRVLTCVTALLLFCSCPENKKVSLPESSKVEKAGASVKIESKQHETKSESSRVNHVAKPSLTRISGQVSYLSKYAINFKTAGVIKQMSASPGMKFEKGQVLAKLEDEDLVLNVRLGKLKLEKAKNNKERASKDFLIEKQLRKDLINSQIQLETSQYDYESALVDFNIAKIGLEKDRKKLADTKLRAPFDCVITGKIKSIGQSTSGPLDPSGILEISELGFPDIHLFAPESLLVKVKVKQRVDIYIPALKRKFTGFVKRFVPVIEESSRQFLVVAQIDKPDKEILSGYFVEATIKL